jgi:hypothetical protein
MNVQLLLGLGSEHFHSLQQRRSQWHSDNEIPADGKITGLILISHLKVLSSEN